MLLRITVDHKDARSNKWFPRHWLTGMATIHASCESWMYASTMKRAVKHNPAEFISRSTLEYCKRTALFSREDSALSLGCFAQRYRTIGTSRCLRFLHVQAKIRKGRKSSDSGDNMFCFGSPFANSSSGNGSPVPSDQQPVNEYQNLLNSVLFSWAAEDLTAYCFKLSAMGGAVALLLGWPVMAWNLNPEEEFVKCGIGALCGGLLAATLAALRMYLGWAYVGNRLFSATVEYEETGWYDGAIWVKPPEVLARDRLLGSYKVKPVLSRVKLTLIGLAASLATCTMFLLFLETTSMHGEVPGAFESIEEPVKQSYGGPYNEASARTYEPDAFTSETEAGLPDYCF